MLVTPPALNLYIAVLYMCQTDKWLPDTRVLTRYHPCSEHNVAKSSNLMKVNSPLLPPVEDSTDSRYGSVRAVVMIIFRLANVLLGKPYPMVASVTMHLYIFMVESPCLLMSSS